jgi:hypothetical protein
MNKITKIFKKLCSPAQLYLALSTISILGMIAQNCNTSNFYVGDVMINPPCHKSLVFFLEILYVLIWTWILNKLCGNGFTNISWLLVMLPYIGMFILLGLFLLAVKFT